VQSAGAVFETDEPLLTAGMSRQEVTVRAIGDDVPRSALGYYTGTVPVTQLAVAPVPRSEPSTYFLLIDATDAVHLDARRARNLMTRFAEGMHLLIEAEASPPEPAPTETEALEPEQAADPSGPAGDGASPRPRSEIIAEEMQRVQQADRQLALALVHLNRAERIAQDGSEAVAAAEDELRTRLQQLDPESRVERFGELTFGVFYTGDAADVEPWAELLQEEMAQATGTLEGGVSIGVALWRDQDPETLREDATEALRVAYETGDCTIVE
jgi:GGDEF domain-containing protein